MKTVTVRELHERTGAIVDLAAEGQVVVVSKRGAVVAELRPLSASSRSPALPDRSKLLARFPQLAGESGRFLELDRS